ncbi:MAG: hypothetical protein ACYC5A_07245 [Thermoleophilia bacterium]
MADEERFPRLEETAARLVGRGGDLTMDELRALLCHDCDFFGDDHEDDLECSCFKMLRLLLARGVLTPESLAGGLGAATEAPEE